MLVALFNALCFSGYTLRAAAKFTVSTTMMCAMASTCWNLLAGLFPELSKVTGGKPGAKSPLRSALSPYFAWMRGWEERLQEKLHEVRATYTLELNRSDDKKVGLQLCRLDDLSSGLEVLAISPTGLVGEYIASPPADQKVALTRVGDRLIRVNEQSIAPEMMRELADQSIKRLELEFSRTAEVGKHYQLWEVELEKAKPDEIWGMHLVRLEEFNGVVVKRVLAGSVVSRWNRKVASRGKRELTVFPGDWILACNKEVAADRFMDMMRCSRTLRLTLIRWLSDSPLTEEMLAEEPQTQVVADLHPEAEAAQVSVRDPAPAFLSPSCSCCGLLGGRYVEMRCAAGETHYLRTDCWRKRYNGLARKHAPTECSCGARVESIEVYERATQREPARLVHTILSSSDSQEAATAEHAERPSGNARKRAASGRRAVQRTVPQLEPAQAEAPGSDAEIAGSASLAETGKPELKTLPTEDPEKLAGNAGKVALPVLVPMQEQPLNAEVASKDPGAQGSNLQFEVVPRKQLEFNFDETKMATSPSSSSGAPKNQLDTTSPGKRIPGRERMGAQCSALGAKRPDKRASSRDRAIIPASPWAPRKQVGAAGGTEIPPGGAPRRVAPEPQLPASPSSQVNLHGMPGFHAPPGLAPPPGLTPPPPGLAPPTVESLQVIAAHAHAQEVDEEGFWEQLDDAVSVQRRWGTAARIAREACI